MTLLGMLMFLLYIQLHKHRKWGSSCFPLGWMILFFHKNKRLHFSFELSSILIGELRKFLSCESFPTLLKRNDYFQVVSAEMVFAAVHVTCVFLSLHHKARPFFTFALKWANYEEVKMKKSSLLSRKENYKLLT